MESRTLALLGLLGAACSGGGSGGLAFDTASSSTSTSAGGTDGATTGSSTNGTDGATTGSPTTSDATTSTDSAGTSSTTGIKLDVGADFDVNITGGDGEGCEKIDFLFVIDNSNSMSDEQQNLVTAFPGFVSAIENVLPDATDFHVGVVDTDVLGFDDTPTEDPNNPCAYRLGGLLSHATPAGEKSGTGVSCNFSSGVDYMVNSASLGTEFQCAALVGTEGNTGEKQAEAAVLALSPAAAAAGQCSDGFLREDALLVLVVITDEDDDWSAPDADIQTNADAWFDAVAGAKADIETNVVFVLLSGGSPKWNTCGPLDFNTQTGADDSPKLTAWAERFTNNFQGSVCEAGFDEVFADAIGTIQTACTDFTPPG